mmetsp:Transcript_47311/g.143274  ORF Transcript_47311/g.143274 Transcript_47311/m.143274 type:complete len:310 (-) Transcript_47311:179-1108(-)
MSTFKPSRRTEEALRHLNKLKPFDGWSADLYVGSDGKRKVALRRRNAPLTERGFEDIVLDSKGTGCIVGITTYITSSAEKGSPKHGRGAILVERDGSVFRTQKDVRVTLQGDDGPYAEEVLNESRERMRNDRERARAAQARKRERSSVSESAASSATLSDEQNMQLITAAMYVVAVIMTVKLLSTVLFSLWVAILPVAFVYAVHTCPSNDTFDAKKELKRVMRGEKLPDDHPEKPKDWLSKSIARVAASVGTELATSLGYEVCLNNILGACTVATVRVPSTEMDFYWIGALGKWYYLMQRQIPRNNKSD